MSILKNINTFLVNFSSFFQFKRAVSILTSLLIIGTVPSSIAEGEKKKPVYYKRASDLGLTNEVLGMDGFYGGLTGGAELGRSNVNTSGSTTAINNFSNNDKIAHNGMSVGAVAGYGRTIKGIYVGGEIAGDLTNGSGSQSSNSINGGTRSSSISVKKQNSISASARVGRQIDEKTLLYVKAGLESNEYRFSSSINQTIGGASTGASSTQNKRVLQPIAGLGAERIVGTIGNNVQVRLGAEYQHSFGKNTNVSLSSDTATGNSKFDTSSDAIKARILFKF